MTDKPIDLRDFAKPNPDDPRNIVDRLNSTGVPMNKGIAMLINAPSLVEGYSCQGCGHSKDFAAPRRMTRDEIRRACCGACASDRVTLKLRGGA